MPSTTHAAGPLADPGFFLAGPPWELFARLRDTEPVAWTPEDAPHSGFWSVTRHADIVKVSRDWQTFTSSRGVSLEELDDDQLVHRTSLIDTDPPRHTALRKLVAPSFGPKVVNGYETFLRGIVGRTLDDALAPARREGAFDLVGHVSSQVPVRVLCRLLDVDDDVHSRLTAWGDRLVGHTDPELADVLLGSRESEEYRLVPFRSPAALEVFEYGRSLAAQRRVRPGSDLVTTLATATIDGEPLPEKDFDNYFLLLALAGQETTRQAVTLAVMTLIEQPGALVRLQEHPELLAGPALDEFLRWGPPVYQMRRTATHDTEIAGVPVRGGDKIALWYLSGNRDGRAIPNPDVFDLDRRGVDLLTFGKGGPHYCMGSFLARLELRVTLQELVARVDTIRLAGTPERLRSNFVNGVKRLPVTVTLR
ncbi:MAG: cytochrome P450 [Kineosporiaceae bacterium]